MKHFLPPFLALLLFFVYGSERNKDILKEDDGIETSIH